MALGPTFLLHATRIRLILRTLGGHVIGLPGTGRRHIPEQGPYVVRNIRTGHRTFMLFEWGWTKARHSTRNSGCALAFRMPMFDQHEVEKIYCPDEEAQI